MKKMHQFMTVLAAAALAACSSMDLNEEEALSENYPSDFNVDVYRALHPNLRSVEVRDYVAAYNTKLKDSLGEAFAAVVAADTTAFLADTASLHLIITDPELGGYSQTLWDNIWVSTEKTTYDTTKSITLKAIKLNPKTTDSSATSEIIDVVVVDSTEYSESGAIAVVYGKTDSTAEESSRYEIGDSSYTIRKGSDKRDTTIVKIDTVVTPVPGTLSGKNRTYAKMFNLYGVENDLEALKAIQSDAFSTTYQYTVFGRSHGWAYRYCTEEEKTHPIQSETFPMKKYYCDDNGIAKEI